jgi:16S rRNA (guanine527-N7)-methyltransferase
MLAQLEQYFILLRQWNQRGNLISRGDESRVIERHALDSLVTIPVLDDIRADSILDLGSVGGLPGIPIKILRPGTDVTLLDSRRMKTLFLLRAVNELGLSGVRVWRRRVEDLGKLPAGEEPEQRISARASVGELGGPAQRPRFDAVVARAVASLSLIAAWAAPLVSPAGHLLAYKGSRLDSEVAEWEGRPGPWRLVEIRRELRPQVHLVILQRG